MTELQEEELKAGDRVTLTGIKWDTDGEDPKDLGLESELTLTLPQDWDEDSSIADLLSDRYGWCVMNPGQISRPVAA